MKFKKVIFALLLLSFVFVNVKAEITGSPISRYEEGESENIVKVKNLSETNEYIGGSVVQIQDENGFILYEFTTPKEEYVVEGLNEGKYYLVQTAVQDEYELNNNKVSFNVTSGTTEVEILNERSIVMPGNMSSNSILLISMAMLDITIIIGVIVYVKKNKIKQ